MNIRLKTEVPGPRSRELMAERQAAVARGPFHVTPVFIARGKGAVLEDVDGNRFIDFAGGLAVLNAGHLPAAAAEAVRRQSRRFLHACFHVTPYEGYVRLCAALNRLAPGDFPKRSFLANSGAEAVENAVKIARSATGRPTVVCFEHAFHGRTYMAMTLTAKEKPYKLGFGPFNPGVVRAPFPYCYRWPATEDPERVSAECFSAFERAVQSVGPEQVAAVIIEPVLGEGGFAPAPAPFLRRLRDYCTGQRIVFIADEVQTGFGRTGELFACARSGVAPDLMTLAKGLGGGMPVSAVVGRAELMDAPMTGGIGGTFGGNPVSCAAALAVVELFETGGLLDRARELSAALPRRLAGLRRFRGVGDVRGLGAMQALELVKDRRSKEPDQEAVAAVIRHCTERGLILMSAGTYGNVIRLLMPLVITDAQLEEGLAVLESGLERFAA
ncbi:MAG: 4-aminobutyrate--2-oxoglutarate transaminase [Elusimicrobia bacterium]|nr:4-aminobutyrate--2-oxoglutarate transaminase [Elusimicrobiota bacterium]